MLKEHASKKIYLTIFLDVLFTLFAILIAFSLHDWLRNYTSLHGVRIHLAEIFIILILWSTISYLYQFKLYYRYTSTKTDIYISMKIATVGVIFLLLFQYMLKLHFFPRTILVMFFVINAPLLIFSRIFQRKLIGYIQKKGYNIKALLIVGINIRSKQFIEAISRYKEWGLVASGVIDINGHDGLQEFQGVLVKGNSKSFRKILHEDPVDEVVFAFSISELNRIKPLMDICAEEGVHYLLISDFLTKKIGVVQSDELFGVPVLSFSPTPKQMILWKTFAKRIFDFVFAVFLIAIASPLMLLIAISIFISSGRPIFYQWNVIGFNKKPIKSWKFRTMVPDADKLKKDLESKNEMNGPVFKITHDPRITPLGKYLRKYSLDELPQLWSVIKGDLSLVGPRPAGPCELLRYKHWHRRKLSIKPGLTCLWQVNGRNGIINFDEWAKLDLQYIDNWNLLLDFKILLKTIPAVIKGTGK